MVVNVAQRKTYLEIKSPTTPDSILSRVVRGWDQEVGSIMLGISFAKLQDENFSITDLVNLR